MFVKHNTPGSGFCDAFKLRGSNAPLCYTLGGAVGEHRFPDSKRCLPTLCHLQKADIASSCLRLLYFSFMPFPIFPFCWPLGVFWLSSLQPNSPSSLLSPPSLIQGPTGQRGPSGQIEICQDFLWTLSPTLDKSTHPTPATFPLTPPQAILDTVTEGACPKFLKWKGGRVGSGLLSIMSELGGGWLFPERSLLRNPPSTSMPPPKRKGLGQGDIP